MHSEWSWDAVRGSMERSCSRAVELGLPSIAFTEHVDLSPRNVASPAELPLWQHDLVAGGMLQPPHLDVGGYLECIARCRSRFPQLRILTGVELGEPHRHRQHVAELLAGGGFDRVLASVHLLAARGTGHETLDAVYRVSDPDQVARTYLLEVLRTVEEFDDFDVLAHIDYAFRRWPRAGGYPVEDFSEEYRAILTVLAAKDKLLEVNTQLPLAVEVLRWWHESGGDAIVFASDAHRPEDVASGFAAAADLAESAGFARPKEPHDVWHRR